MPKKTSKKDKAPLSKESLESDEVDLEVRIRENSSNSDTQKEKILRIESKIKKIQTKADASLGTTATGLDLLSSGKENIEELLESLFQDVDSEEKKIIRQGIDFIDYYFRQKTNPRNASELSKHADHSQGTIYPENNAIRLEKIQRILSKFSIVYPEYSIIRIKKKTHFFEVDARGEFVTMYTFDAPDLPISICLEPSEEVEWLPANAALRPEELILIAKVVSLSLDLLPPEVEQEIKDYLEKGILGNHVGYNLRVVKALRDIEKLDVSSSPTERDEKEITDDSAIEEERKEEGVELEILEPTSLREFFWRKRKRPPLD